jgi:hypothetical protein
MSITVKPIADRLVVPPGEFLTFGRELMRSRDIDPLYPVLSELMNILRLENQSARLWLTFLYVAYYHLPSALAIFAEQSYPQSLSSRAIMYPTGVERRNLRGGLALSHVEHYVIRMRRAGGQEQWLARILRHKNAEQNYEAFWQCSQDIWGNGRWAAYKWSEILKKVHGYPLSAPDLRLQYCSGPRDGLAYLLNMQEVSDISYLNEAAQQLKDWMENEGNWQDDLDWEALETILCNFNSLRKGKYYVGHDIDELQQRILEASGQQWLKFPWSSFLWQARSKALPHAYLGEEHNWRGIQKERMRAYLDKKVIVTRDDR